MTVLESLFLPLQFDFMREALLIAIVVAVPTAILSCLLVLKGLALMGDAISHAVLPGVVLAYVAGIPLEVGAVLAGLACALGTGFIRAHSRLKQDTIMGVVFSSMFGLGVVLHVAVKSDLHLNHILFGDLLGANPRDLFQSSVIALLVVCVIGLKWRDFLLHAFDPGQARVVGLPVRGLHYGLLILLSLTVVGALKAVGIILVIGLLIGPGAIAFLLTRRFSAMLWVAVAVSLASCLAGTYLSFFLDSAPAPTIVVVLTAVFILALIGTRGRGGRGEHQAHPG
ncbi:metal ABC transporter permease [Achromobacter insuavis]|uniref:metal ABC transporter permease n=1 Tax=Achromobacter insuavis TaxID=1287735 RepID=UPI001F146B34|nr:metal ABC transporter permease [Achromobacter insuavis]